MVKFSEHYGGSYLTAAAIPPGREVQVMIERVASEQLDDGHKLVVYFVGKDKGLVLNKTNGSVIASVYGDESDHWLGKSIVIFRSQVMFSGKMTDCLRVRIPAPSQAPQPPLSPAPPTQPPHQSEFSGPVQPPAEYDDSGEIPF